MRKELEGTYRYLADGAVGVRARTADERIVEYQIEKDDLEFDISHTDQQGTVHQGRVIFRPVAAEVIRLDTFLNDLQIIYLAAQNCYSHLPTVELIEKAQKTSAEEAQGFLRRSIIPAKHWSVIEHHGPSFLIDGVSRAMTHQLVRHRLASYSQQSQRYVDAFPSQKDGQEEMIIPVVIPPGIRQDPQMVEMFIESMKGMARGYYIYRADGVYPEDARFLFPNAVASRLVMSANRRVWLEIIPKRTCATAQWEIDMAITQIAKALWEELPAIFELAGPACSEHRCSQGKRSCGIPLKAPLSAFFDNTNYPHDRLIFGMK